MGAYIRAGKYNVCCILLIVNTDVRKKTLHFKEYIAFFIGINMCPLSLFSSIGFNDKYFIHVFGRGALVLNKNRSVPGYDYQ